MLSNAKSLRALLIVKNSKGVRIVFCVAVAILLVQAIGGVSCKENVSLTRKNGQWILKPKTNPNKFALTSQHGR
jgi:hypothetical protein